MVFKIGNGDDNIIFGTQDDDELWGLGGDDILLGGGGNDILNGGSGADTMDGGSGDDTYIVDSKDDVVVEHAGKGDDEVRASITYSLNSVQNVEDLFLLGSADINGYGNTLDNDMYGNSGDNELFGYSGNDYISGGGGDDYISGGVGDDTMLGGTGDDTFVVSSYGDTVTELAGQGTDTVTTSLTYWLGANVENLTLTGSNDVNGFGNELKNTIVGNSGKNIIDGGLGADTMKGGKGDDYYYVDAGDVVVEFAGEGTDMVYSSIDYTLGSHVESLRLQGAADLDGAGNELDNYIKGNSGSNTLLGYGGVDTLDGGIGADTMKGGQGNDHYIVESNGDLVIELANEGTDTVWTEGDTNYTLTNNVENLHLGTESHGNATGNVLDNLIYGSKYDNVIDGKAGKDSMFGGAGDDVYHVDNEYDAIGENANEGHDIVYSTVDYTLDGGVEILSLQTGNAVFATGNDENNTIFGNAFDNVLDGDGGNDSLSGLGGNDTFVFHAHNAHGDVVYEFEGNGAGLGDVLQFVGYGPGATFTQQTATEWFITSGDGSIQEVITLVGAPTIDASDYAFV